MPFRPSALSLSIAALFAVTALPVGALSPATSNVTLQKYFQRVASFPILNNSDIENETVAEIVDVSTDGNLLIYTDGKLEKLGFVDISDYKNPLPAGTIDLPGEPTAVAVSGDYALAGVNTSADFINVSGELIVVDMETRTEIASYELSGQPDSVAVSPDGKYAAIVIENERDEDLGSGRPEQTPAGSLIIVDMEGSPDSWKLREVDLTGVASFFPGDPEPEFVDINDDNIAAVTLQENNHIMLVDLPTGKIVKDWHAGSVSLTNIDKTENDLIELNEDARLVPREPDAITWIGNSNVVTADEGDLDGGSRGITIFDTEGKVIGNTGNLLDHLAVALGHYPENRSGNKGNEPESVEYGVFGDERLLFAGSERSSLIFVYRLDDNNNLEYLQTLPAGVGPEGLKAIPGRNLLIAANEVDDRGDKVRSSISIYERNTEKPAYPTVVSWYRSDFTPIPWGALSGLAVDASDANTAYTVHDSFYKKSRIYRLNIASHPAIIDAEIVLKDSQGKLAAVQADLVNDDQTVNLDLEGISARADHGFWLASEGRGTVGDKKRPVKSPDLLLRVSESGTIVRIIQLPESVNARQVRFGFEGVTSIGSGDDESLFVIFQREWLDDPEGLVRIGRFSVSSGEWAFFYYPLDAAESANGGWVGLSEITALSDGRLAVIERDNQGGPDAAIKRLYTFSLEGLVPEADPGEGVTPEFPVLNKTLARDLMQDLESLGGLTLEKIEGLAALPDGSALVINDNDGVDDSNGETQLLRIKDVF